MSNPNQELSPARFFNAVKAYQDTAAIKTAIELELFTAIGEGKETVESLAQGCEASDRGIRILCDYLVIIGFLTKADDRYKLTPDSAMFLDKNSPAYIGGVTEFILDPMITDSFKNLTETVRKGTTLIPSAGTLAPDHPVWIKFARAMAPRMALPAQLIVKLIGVDTNRKLKILDIAASHGQFGLAFAQHHPQAEIAAVDWPNVLELAKENAEKLGVSDRYCLVPGSAFDVDYGTDYDIVLLTNFLHHFDIPTCEELLRKVKASLASGGKVVTLEWIANNDRVSPPDAAGFSLTMLVSTPSGNAYTFAELEQMFSNAGFSHSELHQLGPGLEQVVISYK